MARPAPGRREPLTFQWILNDFVTRLGLNDGSWVMAVIISHHPRIRHTFAAVLC